MTGSVQQKNGKYYAVLNLYDEKGKRKQKWIATGYPQSMHFYQKIKTILILVLFFWCRSAIITQANF